MPLGEVNISSPGIKTEYCPLEFKEIISPLPALEIRYLLLEVSKTTLSGDLSSCACMAREEKTRTITKGINLKLLMAKPPEY
jgi:hypothetical protein